MSVRLSASRYAALRFGQSKLPGHVSAMRPSLVLVLILSVLACKLSALAEPGESRPRSVLSNVRGLEKTVTYSETKIPLGELVAKLAAETGVPLTAVRGVADEPVAVVVTDFPARELLEQLAELLDYRWSRRGGGKGASKTHGPSPSLEIWQDLASKQHEEALRQAYSAGVDQRFQEEVGIYRDLVGKPQEEMKRLWDEGTRWKERLEKLTPEERQTLENSPEFRRQSLRYDLARRVWSPTNRSSASLMTGLTPEQWTALRAKRQIVFSSHPQPGKLPLPPDVLRVFRTSRLSVPLPGPPRSAQPEDEERLRRHEREKQELQERWDQAEDYDVILRFLAFETAWWEPGTINFLGLAAPVRGGQRLGQQDEWSSFTLNYTSPKKADAPPEDDPGRRALLEQDPVCSVKKQFQPDTRPYFDPLFPGSSRTGRLLPELLPELARTYGVNVIADSYWGVSWRAGWISDRSSTDRPRPLFEVLDGLTGLYHQWDRRGSLVRIRDRNWFLDRPREIPLRHVRRWTALYERHGALPIEEFASAATTLTDIQSDLLSILFEGGVFPPQWNDLQRLAGSRHILRLFGRLTPTDQQALQAGKSLATGQLSPALRPFVLAQLYRGYRARMPLLDLGQWGSGKLTLSRTPDVRLREQRGRSVTWRLESAPAPRAATPPDAVTRFPVTRLRMEIHYGAQTPAVVALIVAADSAAPE
jgi:hypothetical protein